MRRSQEKAVSQRAAHGASWMLLPEGRGYAAGRTKPQESTPRARFPVLTLVPGGVAVGQAAGRVALASSHSPGQHTAHPAPDDISMLLSTTSTLLPCPALYREGPLPLGRRLKPVQFSLLPKVDTAWLGGGNKTGAAHLLSLPDKLCQKLPCAKPARVYSFCGHQGGKLPRAGAPDQPPDHWARHEFG